jgi:hypothetical protein
LQELLRRRFKITAANYNATEQRIDAAMVTLDFDNDEQFKPDVYDYCMAPREAVWAVETMACTVCLCVFRYLCVPLYLFFYAYIM